jgi:glucose/arabinose dehydrogenase
MSKRYWMLIAFVLLTTLLASCIQTEASLPGSETTGTTTASSATVTTATVTTATSETTAVPVETTLPAEPTPSPVPDPDAASYQLDPAYPGLMFDQPLLFAVSRDGSGDAFVVERTGKIWIFADRADVETAQVFLDLSSLVDTSGQEKGLLGLAFHPDFAQNGFFYVNYTNRKGTVIARYTRQSGNSRAADPGSSQTILVFPQPYANHNGGHLAFGPDKYLYIAAGDGGSSGDPQNNAQNRANLLGKILRIDVDHPAGGANYGIPADNPFAGNDQGFREEIFAYGLRNPWRFSFDSQGVLWAADVGQNKREEIDLIEKGGNYGWSVREGTLVYKTGKGVDLASLIPPVWEYDHSQGESITGGYVYEGEQATHLKGIYIYGDYISGRIWALWIDSARVVHNSLLLDTDLNIASFGTDANGELLVVDLKGKIYRLKESS